ncbi:MAG: sigma-54 dependent transcriptional regulator [bacterium]
METILIVDDEKDLRFNLSNILKDEGYNAIAVGDGRKALNAVKKNSPNLVLLDMKLPEMDGMQILEKMKLIDEDLVIIMLTAYGNLNGAVKAMKLGAFDYLAKPFDNEELILVIKRALRTQYLTKEVETLKKRFGEKVTAEELMGESPQIKQVLKQIKIIAPTNMTVILQGESGTGKELIAQMIHQESPRKNNPFIAIDCGAIPDTLAESELFGHEKGAFTGADAQKEGRFEEANGGTLFLDEITNLSSTTQRKLLRVIQERRLQHIGGKRSIKVDVRIIVATNINLSGAVRRGKFREDLFHRLNEFHISLPPLRERKDDIPHLAMRFLEGGNQELNKKIEGFSSDVMKLLLDYPWPGNVRELKNVIRKAVLLCDSNHIKPGHFPLDNIASTKKPEFQQDLDKGVSLKEITKKATKQIEKEAIEQALAKAGGNKTKTAKILKIDRMTLYSKMKEYQIRHV